MTEEEFRHEVLTKLSRIEAILGTENQPGLLHEVRDLSRRLDTLEKFQAGIAAIGAFVLVAITFVIALWKR